MIFTSNSFLVRCLYIESALDLHGNSRAIPKYSTVNSFVSQHFFLSEKLEIALRTFHFRIWNKYLDFLFTFPSRIIVNILCSFKHPFIQKTRKVQFHSKQISSLRWITRVMLKLWVYSTVYTIQHQYTVLISVKRTLEQKWALLASDFSKYINLRESNECKSFLTSS